MKKKKKLLDNKRQPKRQLDCYGIKVGKLESGKVGKISYNYFNPEKPVMRGLGDIGKI